MKEKRFEEVLTQGSGFCNYYQVIVDKKTGVNYLFVKSGYGAGLTTLLDENGNPILSKKEI